MNENWMEVRVQAKITESKGIKKIYIFYENKMQIFFFFGRKNFSRHFIIKIWIALHQLRGNGQDERNGIN